MARELRVRVAADTSQFESSMRSMQERMDRVGRSMTDVGRRMTTTVTAGIVAVGTAAIVATNRLGNMADELLDLEQQTGLTTDQLQEFQNVARVAGVSGDALARAARGLQTQMRATGDESAQFRNALNMLGISARDDATGGLRDMSDLMPEILSELRGMENQTDRNTLAMQLFGSRMAHDLIPVLGMTEEQFQAATAEAHEMGQVLGRDTLESANRARIAWEQFQARLELAGREVTVALVPAVTRLTEILTERLVPVVQALAERVAGAVEWFTELGTGTQNIILGVTGLVAAAGPLLILVGQLTRAVVGLAGAFGTLRTVLVALTGPAGLIALAAGGIYLVDQRIRNARPEVRGFTQELDALSRANLQLARTTTFLTQAQRDAAVAQAQEALAEAQRIRDQAEGRLARLEFELDPLGMRLRAREVAELRAEFSDADQMVRTLQETLEQLKDTPVTPQDLPELPDLWDSAAAAAAAFGSEATGAVDDVTGAIRDAAQAARLWADRLGAEVRLGVKDAEDVLGLLTPRVFELREEAKQALKDFGFDSEEFRDVMAKLDELESALDRIVGPERSITVEPRITVAGLPESEAAPERPIPIPGVDVQAPTGLVSLAALRSQLADARREFETAGTEAARATAEATVRELEAAVEEIERLYQDMDITVEPMISVPEAVPITVTPEIDVAALRDIPIPDIGIEDGLINLERLRERLQEAQRAFEMAFTDAGREAAFALIQETEAAIAEIERQFEAIDITVTPKIDVSGLVDIPIPDITVQVIEQFDIMETAIQQAVSRIGTHMERLGGLLGELAMGAHDTAGDVVRAFARMVVNTIREILSFIVAKQAAIIAVQGFHAATLNPVGFAAAAAGLVAASAAAVMLGGRRVTSPVQEPPADQERLPDPVGGTFGVDTGGPAAPAIGLSVGSPRGGFAVGTPILDGGKLVMDGGVLISESANLFNESTIRFANAVQQFAELMRGNGFGSARALL